ncbi:MAG: 23S rRNA (guanosine(2251)-2'-O)-methyltransferase RlmB [Clostridium sp.]|nr:23S rRNA (guanosine(2251)-2'-O)-methyltransferase RlmB [Clostridium sp.]MCM1444679.1 23S rRNA (guanosine(2251)-2'-O)-methyltransferase RlmB [Candidatus Amulumruptor caecigallinarius]
MYIYGKNVVKELPEKIKIKNAYLYKQFNDKEIIDKLKSKNVKIDYLEKYELDKIVDSEHQGVILKIDDYNYYDIDNIIKDNALIIILDHIMDPHNFGAIIRTAEAAGVDGIIIPKDRSVSVNSTVVKVSAGAIWNTKIVRVTNISNTIEYMKKKGFWIVGTDMLGINYTQIDYKGNIVLVIGNEGDGISKLVKEKCDFIASIPMKGKINSLNASVSTGIMIYEAMRQRNGI